MERLYLSVIHQNEKAVPLKGFEGKPILLFPVHTPPLDQAIPIERRLDIVGLNQSAKVFGLACVVLAYLFVNSLPNEFLDGDGLC